MNRLRNPYRLFLVFTLCYLTLRISYGQADTSQQYYQSLYELSQIKVSSEGKFEQKLSNTSVTMRVITREQIVRNGYFTLEDALAEQPGIQFRDIMGLNSYIFMRGLPRQNNTILILIDGIQINELNSGGFYGGAQYNLSNVERIEIIYGPESVVYGSNAVSGVINLVTRTPGKKSSVEANMAIGSFDTYQTDLSYYHAGEKGKFLCSGMYKNSGKADLTWANNDSCWDDQLEIYERDYALDMKAEISSLCFGFNYQSRLSSTSTYYPSLNTVYKPYGTRWNLSFLNSYIKHQKQLSKNAEINSTLYHRNTNLHGNSVKEVTDTGQTAYSRPNHLSGIESIMNWKLHENLDLLFGLFGHYEVLADGYSTTYSDQYFTQPEEPDDPSMTSNFLLGAFLEADFRFFTYWRFIPGFRMEYHTSYKQVFTPRASLLFSKNKLSSKFIFAQAYRAPRPWDFTDGVGNPDLKPESFNSWSLSNSYLFTPEINMELIVYNNRLFNGIQKSYLDDNQNYYWENRGRILTQGAEVSLAITRNNLKISTNYSFIYSVEHGQEYIDEISPHCAMLAVNYRLTKHFDLGFRTWYYSARKNPKLIQATNSEYVAPAFFMNLYLSLLDYKRTNVQLIIRNLTNAEYYHTSNLQPDRFRQPQLSLNLKLSVKIDEL